MREAPRDGAREASINLKRGVASFAVYAPAIVAISSKKIKEIPHAKKTKTLTL
jgi:hypothetical protein